jgi:hypothetical protein
MTLNVAPQLDIKANPLGLSTAIEQGVSYLAQNFTDIVQNFTLNKNIYIDAADCGDNCTTMVKVCACFPLQSLS